MKIKIGASETHARGKRMDEKLHQNAYIGESNARSVDNVQLLGKSERSPDAWLRIRKMVINYPSIFHTQTQKDGRGKIPQKSKTECKQPILLCKIIIVAGVLSNMFDNGNSNRANGMVYTTPQIPCDLHIL